jgi:putative peptidoglycan lipid II flippase
MLKLILFSAAAALPVLKLNPCLADLFSGGNRIISLGIPLVINAFVFGVIGVALLIISRDKQFMILVKKLKR